MPFIVSLSGGKDSTAMLHMMIERGEDVHSVVWFNTGWEFPEMRAHLNEVERRTGIEIVELRPPHTFAYIMCERELPHGRIGAGWPSPMRRWCTREKSNALDRYRRSVPGGVMCIGFAADETHRLKTRRRREMGDSARFPLIEWKVTEKEALRYCLDLGYDWGGLYSIFRRVSCVCCPLQGLGELRLLRRRFPDLWRRMLAMESRIPPGKGRRFNHEASVSDLDRRFAEEDRQGELALDAREKRRT